MEKLENCDTVLGGNCSVIDKDRRLNLKLKSSVLTTE